MAWTAAQEDAIFARDGGIIVSAAAGSGKTSVLVERLLRILVEESPQKRVPADRIIVVTYTNDAASEMKSRLTRSLDAQLRQNPQSIWLRGQQIRLQSAHISTISSFCFDLIRDHTTECGVNPGFRILDEFETGVLLSHAADGVLNRWYAEHPDEMQYLWKCFCEKNDSPLENILLELHTFLESVPFREAWRQNALALFSLPLSQSIYHRAFLEHLNTQANMLLHLAKRALDLSYGLYEGAPDNGVLAWIEEDVDCLEHFLRELENRDATPETLLQPFQTLKERRNRKQFPRKKKNIQDALLYDDVKQIRDQYYNKLKKLLEEMQRVLPFESLDLEQHRKLLPLLIQMEQDLSETAWDEKEKRNALSFEDGERLALTLLADVQEDGRVVPSALAQSLSEQYELIMIDEYQDSNNKLDVIFKLLSHNCLDPADGTLRFGDNVFLVGDVKQSIYRFRLANPQNFMRAIESTKQEKSACRHIMLNQNFRSTPGVLDFVNFVCGNLMSPQCGDILYDGSEALQVGSNLKNLIPKEEQAVHIALLSNDPEVVEKEEENEERLEETPAQVQYIVRQIANMIVSGQKVAERDGTVRPCEYRDFCILLRNNESCSAYAHALEDAGIPAELPDEKGYLRAREIGILLDMLRVLDNPYVETSLAGVMLSPMFSFHAEELLALRLAVPRKNLYLCLRGVLSQNGRAFQLPETLLLKCRDFYQKLQKLQQDMGLMSLESFIRRIYDTTDFLSVIQLAEDGSQKRANLQLLLQFARKYEENADPSRQGVPGFLRYVDRLLERRDDSQSMPQMSKSENVVAVKTMHRSKGLEYPFVFLGGLDTKFSTQDSKKTALFTDNGLAGFSIKDPEKYTSAKTLPYTVIAKENEKATKSEELRLLYVAMTRARQQLFLPLLLDKIQIKKTSHLNSFASYITKDGKLPPTMVQGARSMAQWIWMCLLLLHEDALNEIYPLPAARWEAPAWRKNVNIRYVVGAPKPLPETQIEQVGETACTADDAKVADLRRLHHFHAASVYSAQDAQLGVSVLLHANERQLPSWERPAFLREEKLSGTERGSAIHAFFQHADFEKAERDFDGEKERLLKRGFLSQSEADAMTPEIMTDFLQDPIYKRIQQSPLVLRERKFWVSCRDINLDHALDDILKSYAEADSMLRGVIDLAFREGDHMVLLDYKTNSNTTPQELKETYYGQLMIYKAALQRMTNLPVKECYIYSTDLRCSILL